VARRPTGAHLVARRDGVLCTVCGEQEPIHTGDGTPLPALLIAYGQLLIRHPAKKHRRVHGR
jgi:hypothetical protein